MRHDALNRISIRAAGMLSVLLFLTACSSGVPDRYRELTGFKGIELYVWENAPAKDLCFGFLEGTNRNKTEEDFRFLYENPVDLRQARGILAGYGPDIHVIVMPLGEPLLEGQVQRIKKELDGLHRKNMAYPRGWD